MERKRIENPFAGLDLSEATNADQTNKVSEIEKNRESLGSPDLPSQPGVHTRQSRSSLPASGSGTRSSDRARSVKRRKDSASSANSKASKKGRAAASTGALESENAEMEVESDKDEDQDHQEYDPFARMQSFMADRFNTMDEQFRGTNENIKKVNNSLGKLSDKVGVNARNLARLKTTVEQNSDNTDLEVQKLHGIIERNEASRKSEIDDIKSAIRSLKERPESGLEQIEELRRRIDTAQPRGTDDSTSTERRESAEETEYWIARNSLRLWPVDDRDGSELLEAAIRFIHDKLRVPHSSFEKGEIEGVLRPAQRERNARSERNPAPVNLEAIVQFKSTAVRDYIMSHVTNLAPFVDDSGKPTAGVRLEIPVKLGRQFQDFLRYGRALHKRHGTGLKRHIKFDHTERKLFMEVRLPNSDEWLFVDHQLAIEDKREWKSRSIVKTRNRLASSISGDEPSVSLTPERGADNPSTNPNMIVLKKSKTLEKFNKGRPSTSSASGPDWE